MPFSFLIDPYASKSMLSIVSKLHVRILNTNEHHRKGSISTDHLFVQAAQFFLKINYSLNMDSLKKIKGLTFHLLIARPFALIRSFGEVESCSPCFQKNSTQESLLIPRLAYCCTVHLDGPSSASRPFKPSQHSTIIMRVLRNTL